MTAVVHRGEIDAVTQASKATLSGAFKAQPERFVRGMPWPPPVPQTAWINNPKTDTRGSET
jgi:hypothetical protein